MKIKCLKAIIFSAAILLFSLPGKSYSTTFDMSIGRLYPIMDRFFYPSPPYSNVTGTRLWTYPVYCGFSISLHRNVALKVSIGYEHVLYQYWIDWGGLDVSFINLSIHTIPLSSTFLFYLPVKSKIKPFFEFGPSLSLVPAASLDEDHRDWNTTTKTSADITEHISTIFGVKIGAGLTRVSNSVMLSIGTNYLYTFSQSIVKSSIAQEQWSDVSQPTNKPVNARYAGLTFCFTLGILVKPGEKFNKSDKPQLHD